MKRLGLTVWLPAIQGGSGVDVHTRRLAAGLDKRGVGVQISWFSIYFEFAPYVLACTAAPSGTNIIHALSWVGFAFKRRNIPLLISEQLDVLDPSYRPYKSLPQAVFHQAMVRPFMVKSFAAASAVTAVSRATAESLAQTVRLKSAAVIPNFVDTAVFRPQSGSTKSAKRFRLLFVGNLTKRKGADLLAPIMSELGDEFELCFTTGLRNGKLRNIPTNMKSIGRLTDDVQLVRAYQECDALLFPSRLEGLPIAPLEGMACGKPVIATRASAMPEVIEHGTTGLLCEPDNVNQLVEACRTLADSPEKRRGFGDAARERVEKTFSEDVVVPQYVALYESLMNKKTA
jgi:glycosyltransferase involved in cell wall biosynthesis